MPSPVLFPRLPHGAAGSSRLALCKSGYQELVEEVAFEHPAAYFTPTGGTRVTSQELEVVRTALWTAWHPIQSSTESDTHKRAQFDAAGAQCLYEQSGLDPGEASRPEVWNFLSCVVFPDIARWRFPKTTDPGRFLGGVRNTLQRLWWRAHLLGERETDTPYSLLTGLLEDQMVAIMERPNLRATPALARAMGHAMLDLKKRLPKDQIEAASRDRVKKIRQLFPIVSVEALTPDELTRWVDEVFNAYPGAPASPRTSSASVARAEPDQTPPPTTPPAVESTGATKAVITALEAEAERLRARKGTKQLGGVLWRYAGKRIARQMQVRYPEMDHESVTALLVDAVRTGTVKVADNWALRGPLAFQAVKADRRGQADSETGRAAFLDHYGG